MAGAGVIKEFLVALGWKIDEPGLKKFETAIGRATHEAVTLGEAVLATATAVEVAVVRISRQFEELYYTSQRTGASVTSLRAWEFGAKQIGVSADASRSAVEGLARAMRNSPGISALLNQLGVKTAGRDTGAVLNDLIGQLRKMPFYLAQQYGQMLGIDPDTLLMLEQGYARLASEQQDYVRRQKEAGVDADDLAVKSTDLGRKLNLLWSNIGLIVEKVVQDWFPVFSGALDTVNDLVAGFMRLNNATNSWAGTLAVAVGSLASLAAAKTVLGWFFRRGAAGAVAEGGAAAAGSGAAAGGSGAAGAAVAAGAGWLARLTGVGTFLWGVLHSDPANAGEDEITAARHAALAGGGTLGQRNNNPGNLRSWGGAPSTGGFAQFPTALAGMSAMAQQLLLYGQRGISTISAIINKYAPAGDGNNVGAYVADVSRRTGYDPNLALDLRDPEVLRKVMDAMINHEQGGNPWGAALENAAIAGRLGTGAGVALAPSPGSGGVQVSQKTEVNVNGSGDPRAVADTVVGAQQRVNADLVRNMVGAAR